MLARSSGATLNGWQRPSLLQEKWLISWLPKLQQRSDEEASKACQLCPLWDPWQIAPAGSFQLFPFSILAYSLNKENKMKAFKDNAVFHKQMQNKAQEILSKVKNESCLFKAYLEGLSLLVDRSKTSRLRLLRSLNGLAREANRMMRVKSLLEQTPPLNVPMFVSSVCEVWPGLSLSSPAT